ncbi:MAG: AMP-binding protein [Cellvibrionaceae bacterium]
MSEKRYTSLPERLYHWEQNAPDRVWLRQPRNRQWQQWTWQQAGQEARRMATYLKQQNLAPGSRVALYAKNCAEWIISDLAIMLSGLVSVPLYPGQSASSMRYVMEHSDSKLLIIGGADDFSAIEEAKPEGIKTIAIDRCTIECDISFAEIQAACEPMSESPIPDLDTMFTIMYTSGTTGNPKGVMHLYRNAAFSIVNMMERNQRTEADRFVSYLPLSHAAERIVIEVQSLYCGAPISFIESLDTFVEDLREIRPTLFFSVPRLWKKFKEGVESKLPPRKLNLMLKIPFLSSLIKKKVQQQLGLASVDMFITGSAPVPLDVQQWYLNLGMPLQDGYGMTENFIYGCMCEGDPIPGSVGKPMDNCELKISDEGEVLFKSEALMKGYYLEPEKTAEVLRNGYYHTGDTGYLDDDGNLYLTGRLSETFKTSKGKFIRPAVLENQLGDIAELGQMCIMGHGMDQPVLLAGLSEAGQAMSVDAVRTSVESAIESINQQLPAHEQMHQVLVVSDEWTPDNEMLTPTLKLKRNVIGNHYKAAVESLIDQKGVFFEREVSTSAVA